MVLYEPKSEIITNTAMGQNKNRFLWQGCLTYKLLVPLDNNTKSTCQAAKQHYTSINLSFKASPSSRSTNELRLFTIHVISITIRCCITLEILTLKVLNLKPLRSGMGEVVPARTLPTLHPP